jgi:hypothetical protein
MELSSAAMVDNKATTADWTIGGMHNAIINQMNDLTD